MRYEHSSTLAVAMGIAVLSAAVAVPVSAAPLPAPDLYQWTTVVSNNDLMPETTKNFNSYNQPSVNMNGMVVIRARSRGGSGGQPTHGIYTRDMSLGDVAANPITRILDRTSEVPQPNNLGTTFVETPSFPRIDMWSDTIATRGNHAPVWKVLDPDTGEILEQAGTTGIYTNPFGDLITGASKLGGETERVGKEPVQEFPFFEVPEAPGMPFDVFPGAPAVTEETTLVFKGNYTVNLVGKTGVYYRKLVEEPILDGTSLSPAGGTNPVVLIANNTDTLIPGTEQVFGSTSPPSAANGMVVFSGFDDEAAPTLGGIYLAPLVEEPELTTLVSIGQRVPGEPRTSTFSNLGEGGAFDGRHVGFWGAWGTETRRVRLYCQTEGNKDRIAYCNRNLVCEDTTHNPPIEEDVNSICDDVDDPYYSPDPDIRICYQEKEVPVNQGIFTLDTANRGQGNTSLVARTGSPQSPGTRFTEFLFWNYSGKVPCVGGGHSEEGAEDDGEPARWRSSAFVAVSGRSTAFKAIAGDVTGIYVSKGPGRGALTVLDTRTDGQAVDPEAPAGSVVTELGLEREGLRGDWLAVTATMGVEGGTEEEGMAGVYITRLPRR